MNWNSQVSAILLFAVTLLGCDDAPQSQLSVMQDSLDYSNTKNTSQLSKGVEQFAQNLKLNYRVLDNISANDCERLVTSKTCFDAQIKLEFNQSINLPPWKIYFSNMSPILQDDSELMDITHVNGDQHFISPTAKFKGWNGDQSIIINFKAEFWHLSEFDSPPNFYLVAEGHQPKLIASTLAKIDPVTGQEIMAHMTPFTDAQKQFKRGKQDLSVWHTAEQLFSINNIKKNEQFDIEHQIIPTPNSIDISESNSKLDISTGLNIKKNTFQINKDNPAVKRLQAIGIAIDSKLGVPVVIKQVDPESFVAATEAALKWQGEIENPDFSSLLQDAYSLEVNANQINIRAVNKSGAFYALQSIAGLYYPGSKRLVQTNVLDKPRYAYRGFFMDVARNFRNKEFIIKLLDQMAAYKLNKFHFHLGDDEGWRLEIPGLPELTELGAKRCHDPSETRCLSPQLANGPYPNGPNNGFYSIQDYQEIIRAASIRHIELIPSFDMPGHSRAAVKSMQLRHKKYRQLGDKELADEYLLSDLNDRSEYSSVQFYSDNTLNVCKESTYRFVEKVLSEVITFHQSAGQPLKTYHIGADETAGAWKDSPECQLFTQQNHLKTEQLTGYFIQRVSNFLASKNIVPGGWSDGLSLVSPQQMPDNVHVNVWTPLFWEGHKVAHKMVNRDWRVVLSNPDVTYFDFPYQADPKERGYYWGARFTNTRQIFEWMPDNLPIHAEIWKDRNHQPFVADDRPTKASKDSQAHLPKKAGKYYYGIQAQLWSEMVRSNEIAEYLIFPRLLALAERAWNKPTWEVPYDIEGKLYNHKTQYFSASQKDLAQQNWLVFANTVAVKEMPKLDLANIDYRLPTAGAKLSGELLLINSAFPGLPLQYKVGNGEWQLYDGDNLGVKVDSSKAIIVRTTNLSGDRFGRTLKVNKN